MILFQAKEIIKILGISKSTLDNWRNSKKISFIKDGNKTLYDLDEIKCFLESKRKPMHGIRCKLCNKVTKYKNYKQFTLYHLKSVHNMTPKEYYDFMFPGSDKCKCGKYKKFLSIEKGYTLYCNDPSCKFKIENNKIKTKDTCLEKYGDPNYKNFDKKKETSKTIHGNETYTNREKFTSTIKEKYGVDNIMHIDSVKCKSINSRNKNYNTIKNKISNTHIRNFIPILKDRIQKFNVEFVDYNSVNDIKIKCNICGGISSQNSKLIYYRTHNDITPCLHCFPIKRFVSNAEKEMCNFISENCDYDIVENDRKTIGKELDVYIPELKLAIEFNGIYWHSDIIKSRKYHLAKTELCAENGIRLLHIFEDEWRHNKNLIKCKLLNILNKTNTKIYARKCHIKLCTPTEQKYFYNVNHQQGYTTNSITYGLVYENEIVSMMSFSTNRKNYDFELVRFATEKNSNVIGGASKLLKAFSKEYPNKKIVSYADRCWSIGKLYETIGFTLARISPPTYFYVDPITFLREHKSKFRKENLKKLGYDIEGKTEKKIVDEETDYLRIYNCGYLVYEYIS